MHAAIPTIYQGIRFRSRLEAKWACFFTTMGWHWEYEPLDLPGWIPDFAVEIPDFQLTTLVECKPCLDARDRAAQIKIEQAFGAPRPRELRRPDERPPTGQEWAAWGESLPYELLMLGAAPFVPPGESHSVMGNRYDPVLSWFYWGPMQPYGHAWANAVNALQWRAPR